MHASRLATLQASLPKQTAVLLSDPYDIRYYAGVVTLVATERDAFVLVTPEKTFVFHNRFTPIVKHSDLRYFAGCAGPDFAKNLVATLDTFRVLAIDKPTLSVAEYEAIQAALAPLEAAQDGTPSLTIEPFDRTKVNDQRARKDAAELPALRRAGQVAAAVWAKLQPTIAPGQSELEVKQKLDMLLLEHHSDQPAFPTIVAFGEHTALPHHQPTETVLKPETPILLDFGATVAGYRSDMTRTWWFGHNPAAEFLKIEQLVMAAYQTGLEELKQVPLAAPLSAPLLARQLDEAVRQVIREGGYGDYFIHTTGHGVGLDIHEQPSLSWKNESPLVPSMVVTVEPGIYLENTFGFRYENTVELTETGCVVLTG